MLALLLLFWILPAYGNTAHQLPLKAICNGQWMLSTGSLICNETAPEPVLVKFKIPPTQGQYRALNCQKDLTHDNRPDDFNYMVTTGFWFWQRTVYTLKDNPTFSIGQVPQFSMECPITISVAAQNAGTYEGQLVYRQYDPTKSPASISFTCGDTQYNTISGSPGAGGLGVARCAALEGSPLPLKVYSPSKVGVLDIKGCGVNENLKFDENSAQHSDTPDYALMYPYPITVAAGVCVLKIEVQWLDNLVLQTSRADILIDGRPLAKFDIAVPTITKQETNWYWIYEPYAASLTVTDIYQNGNLVWTTGPDMDSVYHVERHNGDTVCTTAYSTQDSMSGVCYNTLTDLEVPYDFN